MSLAEAFEPRKNSLNALRLVLATGVIFWHAFPLSGRDIAFGPARQLLGEVFVDGFFAISGFLIAGAWVRNPRVRHFLTARALRIFPAFWACLLVTAFLIAPASIALSSAAPPQIGIENVGYVLKNATLNMLQWDIAGSPTGVPYEGVWNGSLWTLRWEFLCYLGVLALGVAGLLRRRAVVATLFCTCVAGLGMTTFTDFVPSPLAHNFFRFGLMFAAGVLVFLYQERIRVTWPALALLATVVFATMWLPDYRLVGAIPLAVLLLGIGARVRHPRLQLRNDISYGVYIYAFPLQQALVLICGADDWSVLWFGVAATVLTVPFAAASWFWLERPIQNARRNTPARRASLRQRAQ